LGAGANDFSFFNFGKYVDGSSFYVKIKFSRQVLYSSLSFNIYGYNDTTQEFEAIFNSPYTQSSDDLNYIGGNITIDSETSYVYADTFVVSVNQMPIFESGQEANVWKEIRFKLKATDIPGNTIEIGEI
jgi:hypothetical protein